MMNILLGKLLKPVSWLALISFAILSGCATTTASVGTECVRWKAIYWSKDDTVDTIAQVKEHNAVWKQLCGA